MSEQNWDWSDRLSLRYEPMDATHREFVACCVALRDAGPSQFIAKLDELIEHSVAHFEQENIWMERYQFPPLSCHKQEHDAVLDIMREVRRRVLDGESDLGGKLAQEIPYWFEQHVDSMDAMLAQFLSRLGLSEKELQAAPQPA